MRLRLGVTLVLLGLTMGCGNLAKNMQASWQLAQQIQAAFHQPAAVTILNSNKIILGIPVDPTASKESQADLQNYALRLAQFAATHYTQRSQITEVTVVFTAHSDYGIVHVNSSKGSFSWPTSALVTNDSSSTDSTRRPQG